MARGLIEPEKDFPNQKVALRSYCDQVEPAYLPKQIVIDLANRLSGGQGNRTQKVRYSYPVQECEIPIAP